MDFSKIEWLKKKVYYIIGYIYYIIGKYYIIGWFLLHYREVLHYREFITSLEQNIIIDIFQGIPLIFMAVILKIGIRFPLGILSGF